jgi:lysophospholipase L1-like esterase
MKHHIRPCLARKPREIILHVGTNDLAKKNPQEIVNVIADIVNISHVESPATKPVLSEIMRRTDSSSYIPKIGKINQQLQSYCQDQNIDLIQHGNLQAKHLNSYGVHLNRAGNSIFAKNLIGYFNKDSGN